MAWWTRVNGTVKKHDQKFGAMVRINVTVGYGEAMAEECGLYRRDPEKHADEPNLLPGEIEKAQRKRLAAQIRGIMGKGKRRG